MDPMFRANKNNEKPRVTIDEVKFKENKDTGQPVKRVDSISAPASSVKTEAKERPKEDKIARKQKKLKFKKPNLKKATSSVGSAFKKLGKKQTRIIIVVVVVIAVGLGAFFIINDATMPVKISVIETTKALSSRTEDAPVQSTFKQREPIMLRFEFNSAQVGSGIKFEVRDQEGKIVKSGTTTILRPTGDDKDSGVRFVSIVNTPSTALPIGKYTIDLSFENRLIRTISFTVTE